MRFLQEELPLCLSEASDLGLLIIHYAMIHVFNIVTYFKTLPIHGFFSSV